MKKITIKSFPKGSNLQKAQYTIRNDIPYKGSVYKEQVFVCLDSSLQMDYTERMLPGASSIKAINRVITQVGVLIVQNVV